MSMTVATAAGRAASAVGAAIYDPFIALGERRGMRVRRADLLAAARGATLEVGAGTGRNVAAYPAGLERLVLTEPDPAMLRRLRRRAARRAQSAVAPEVVAAGAEALPFPDAAFDTIVSTMVLCTVPDPAAAIAELRRVLKPGGQLLFIEHVRAADARLARSQDRFAAPWRAFAAGCRCNQETLPLLRTAFSSTQAEPATWRGMPRIVSPLLMGRAIA